MQVVRIRMVGNSAAVTIPRAYLQQLHWGLGQYLTLEIKDHILQAQALHEHYQPQLRPPTTTQEAPSGAA